MGVADERDALAFLRESTGLLHGEEGLAAASAAADLDTMDETDRIEDDSLMFGKRIGGVFIRQSAGDHVALR